MLAFTLAEYVNSIDQVITKSLAKSLVSGQEFSWYLSLQLDQAIPYDSIENDATENALLDNTLSYSGIYAISYQRESYYANDYHFSQAAHQHQNLHKTASPSTYVAWLNAVQPLSLTANHSEKTIADELIKNSPYTSQVGFIQQNADDALNSEHFMASEENNDTYREADFPSDENVDFLYKRASEALDK